MNNKKLVFQQIHMGQRLQHFVSKAPHGKGPIAIARLLGIGKTTVYNAYQRQTFDMVEVEKICDFYEITVFEFLGIETENMPENFKSPTRAKVPEFDIINKKLDKILEQLTKSK